MKADYSRKVEMICPVCGGKTFQYESAVTDSPVTCVICKRTFSRDQLVNANQENVDANLNELGDEVMKDVRKDISDMIQKTFGNNKNFRIG
jgi:predicted  nucleic acid-binding Zn-ribbon protein